MAQERDAPAHERYSHVRIEEAVIVDVNRSTYTVTADTRHSNKTVSDIQVLVPYHHYENGEGIHHLPEVGAICYLLFPSDNTSPFILGYVGAAGVTSSTDGAPVRSTPDGQGSPSDVSFKSRRPDLQPGDIAFTTRDDNFIVLRRGGVLQLGATPISQRIYIPILNYIKDFCENYEMYSFGGDIAWTVGRQESDPSGNAPATYTFHMNEFAQDSKATVRVRHLPVTGPGGGNKAAWEVYVAPQNINRDTGAVTNEVYSLIVTTSGDKTELIGGSRTVHVKGDDGLTVDGDRSATVVGKDSVSAGELELLASGMATFGGATTKIGGTDAAHPAVYGDRLLAWFGSAQWTVSGGAAVLSTASLTELQQILATAILLK